MELPAPGASGNFAFLVRPANFGPAEFVARTHGTERDCLRRVAAAACAGPDALFRALGLSSGGSASFCCRDEREWGPVVDPVEQSSASGSPNYSVGLNLVGVNDLGVGILPSDANLAVGDTQVVQWVNVSYSVYNKTTGALQLGPIAGSQLWAGFGGYCETINDGDIIAQWDKAAHRWVLFENVIYTNPATACFAVSTTPDATGTYYRFAFPLYNQHNDNFPDYPKIGTWTTSYVQTQNNFGNSGDYGSNPCVYDRIKMLHGDGTAQQVCFQLTQRDTSLLPADIDSNTPPPAGQDVFLIGSVAKVDKSHLSLYSIHIDWSNPQSATITGSGDSQLIAVPTYAPACPGQQLGACAPELDGENLETLSDRLMYRFVYYIDQPASHVGPQVGPLPQQHWYTSHAVTASGGQVGMRWYEFRAPLKKVDVSAMTLFQSGTYAPDMNYRFMGSMAQDKVGDILMGYTVSSASMYPSLAAAGRTTADPLGMFEPEVPIIAGTGAQIASDNRWGDYSSIALDGSDGCTFWYTGQYYITTSSFNFATRLASLKFSGCK